MTTSIRDWLEQLGLQKYAAVFAEHEITPEVLPDLTEEDLDRLALPIGPRRRLLVAIRALATAAAANRRGSSQADAAPTTELYQAERRQLTVMFCDLVGSTALSVRLDPEQLRELMQAYRKACTAVVERYEGHVAQYLGDGLMVYFGWPTAHEDDAERGVRAALEIVAAVTSVRADQPLEVCIGVATGTVVVGDTSENDNAQAKLAVGETPNLAARLQRLAQPNEIVIAPSTRRLVGAVFELSDLGVHRLDGIARPVHAWGVLAVHRPLGRFDAAHMGETLTPFVGRDEEVALLLRRWKQVREGEGQIVSVSGQPGIGKSRLIQVLRERIVGEAHLVLRYQGSPYHRNSSLYPVIEQLELAAGFAREDTPQQKLDKLEALLAGDAAQRADAAPLLAALLSLPVDRYPLRGLSPQTQKDKTIEALVGQFEALSREGPVLIVVEDVHWIDPTTQEALEALAPRVQSLPILLLITYRPGYKLPGTQQAQPTVIGLSRLGRRQGEEFVHKLLEGRVLPEEVLEQIVARADGVPLFIEELTKSVLESGLLRESGDRYTLDTPLPAMAIPSSLRDSLLARLDRLAPVKEIIQIGACIGREFSYQTLARVAPVTGEQLDDALRKLTGAGLVYRRGTPPNALFKFKHALVQDAAYDSLLKSKRQQLHARIAQVLQGTFSDQIASEPELLAHHYTQAENPTEAIAWWREAGTLAARRGALQESVSHFQKGLALIEQLPNLPERDRLELSIREPLNAAWTGLRGWAAVEVTANATAMLGLAKRVGQSRTLGVGLWAIWVNTITQGRIVDSLEWAQRLLAEAEQAGDLDLRIYGHGAAMISYFYLGRLIEARAHGDRVLALYDPQYASRWMQVTANDFRTLVGIWSGQWTWMLGYPDQAVQLSDEKDAYARRLGHRFNLGFALTLGAYAFDYRCEPEPLLERIREADRAEREEHGPFMNQVMVPQLEGLARLRNGQIPEAIASLRRGLDNWYRTGGRSRIPYLKSALAEATALNGDLAGALALIDECLEQIERPRWEERSHLAEVLRLKGWMLAQQGRDEQAEAALRASLDWACTQQAKSWELRTATTLAELWAKRGQRKAARELLAPIYDWFSEGFGTRDLKAARALLQSLR